MSMEDKTRQWGTYYLSVCPTDKIMSNTYLIILGSRKFRHNEKEAIGFRSLVCKQNNYLFTTPQY